MSFLSASVRSQAMRLPSLRPQLGLASQRSLFISARVTGASQLPATLLRSGPFKAAFDALPSILATTSHRPFSTTRLLALRESYFQRPLSKTRINQASGYGLGFGRGGGSGGGSGSGNSWFRNFRRRLDSLPPMFVVYGLIGLNVAIYGLWQYAHTSWSRFRDPSLYYWMTRNFIVSEANFAAGRLHTLLTACFSHSTSSHIFLNMLGLYFIAPATVGLLGTTGFLGLYLGGGIISSLVSLGWHRIVTGNRGKPRGSEGASGAIYASLAYFAAMFPQAKFLMFFIVPMPAWVAVGGIFAYDLYQSILVPTSMTDSAGHIGGILAGVGFALVSRGRGGLRGGPRVPWR